MSKYSSRYKNFFLSKEMCVLGQLIIMLIYLILYKKKIMNVDLKHI